MNIRGTYCYSPNTVNFGEIIFFMIEERKTRKSGKHACPRAHTSKVQTLNYVKSVMQNFQKFLAYPLCGAIHENLMSTRPLSLYDYLPMFPRNQFVKILNISLQKIIRCNFHFLWRSKNNGLGYNTRMITISNIKHGWAKWRTLRTVFNVIVTRFLLLLISCLQHLYVHSVWFD